MVYRELTYIIVHYSLHYSNEENNDVRNLSIFVINFLRWKTYKWKLLNTFRNYMLKVLHLKIVLNTFIVL